MSELNTQDTKRKALRKPRRCPNCGFYPMASILYGMPRFDEKMEKDIEEGRVVLGGCEIGFDDPAWMCTKCGLHIYKEPPDWPF